MKETFKNIFSWGRKAHLDNEVRTTLSSPRDRSPSRDTPRYVDAIKDATKEATQDTTKEDIKDATNIGGANRRCPTKIHYDKKGHLHGCQGGRGFPY